VENLDARFRFIFLLTALSSIYFLVVNFLCFSYYRNHTHASNLNLFVALIFLIPQLFLFSLQNLTTFFFSFWFLKSEWQFDRKSKVTLTNVFFMAKAFHGNVTLTSVFTISSVFIIMNGGSLGSWRGRQKVNYNERFLANERAFCALSYYINILFSHDYRNLDGVKSYNMKFLIPFSKNILGNVKITRWNFVFVLSFGKYETCLCVEHQLW
jgi:hypothetical protein